MTVAQQREAARQFAIKWTEKGKEDEDGRSYWIQLLQDVFGIDNVVDRLDFEKKVVGYDGNIKRIDVYIPETKVLIEQKSLGISLDKPQSGHGGKTPYEQAKEYADGLPYDEKPRWIVTSNFAQIWIYDMNEKKPWENILVVTLNELQTKYPLLSFLYRDDVKKITEEMELSLKAGELVGKIHDRFLEQYHDPMAKKTQTSLNILCVRLVFCLYAEDAGLFGEKDAFQKYIEQYEPKDIRQALINLFEVLNTPTKERADLYLSDELEAFPYVNGGLFERKNIVIPKVTDEIKKVLIESSLFDWSKISPTIFGAVFESTLNPETRRAGGMHYTSIENIHKVIDPLFLDDLRVELKTILKKDGGAKTKALRNYQNKIADLHFFDPACGSGNFLTETYLCLRRLENEVIQELSKGQIQLGLDDSSPIKVSIDHFHGIEINNFAVTVARTALWIAESQMMDETKHIVFMPLDFLPIKTQADIIGGNALRIEWEKVLSPSACSYIIGNPPFNGARYMSKDQKADVMDIFDGWKNSGDFDYVSCWYKKAADYIAGTIIRCALVSTNSICQGQSVSNLWRPLFDMGLHIDFAYRTFVWNSEATDKAHVHCVIVGFSMAHTDKPKIIFLDDTTIEAHNINGYLIDADNIFIEKHTKPLCEVPVIKVGSQPIDDGNYLFTYDEMVEYISKEPQAKPYIYKWYGSKEFIEQKPRYCLFLQNCPPSELKKMPIAMQKVKNVKEFREKSNRVSTKKAADYPARFGLTTVTSSNYIIMPKVSSERRRYIPMGFMTPDNLCSDLVFLIPGASLYHFGVLTSNVHMSWMRIVCGRLKSDYRYSKDIVYNNFPWPDPDKNQRKKIEQTAQGILDARALYPDASLADLYDPLTMPPELIKAHRLNDAAVMEAYGMPIKETSEDGCVAWLMRMYQEMTK